MPFSSQLQLCSELFAERRSAQVFVMRSSRCGLHVSIDSKAL